MRDYTPRHFDAARRELTLDFILHDAGPATAWAQQVKIGDQLGIGGPRGSQVVADVFDWYLLLGDETAMPAIGRRLRGVVRRCARDRADRSGRRTGCTPFTSRASLDVRYVYRRGAAPGATTLLDDAVHALDWPTGEGFVYIAGEAGMMRRLKEHVTSVRNHPRDWMRASGYWKPGVSNHHD